MRECVRLVHLEANEERKDTETKTETRRKGTKKHFGPVLFLRFFFSFYWFIFFTGFFFPRFSVEIQCGFHVVVVVFFLLFSDLETGPGRDKRWHDNTAGNRQKNWTNRNWLLLLFTTAGSFLVWTRRLFFLSVYKKKTVNIRMIITISICSSS